MTSERKIVVIGVGLLTQAFLFVSGTNYYSLGGVDLRLGGYDNPPYDALIHHRDGNYSYVGVDMNVVQWLSKKLNFSITVVPITDEATIAKIGIYETAFSKLINKELDGLIACLIVSPSRAERMDYTSMLAWMEPFTIVGPKPEYESRLFAFIRPFQPVVWLFLAVTLVFFIGFMSAFSWFYKSENTFFASKKDIKIGEGGNLRDTQKNNYPTSIGYNTLYVINILTNHGSYTPYSKYSFRVLAGCWLLASLVLVNSYSSIVVSSLTVPVLKPAVNSMEDLANNDKVSLIILKNVVLGIQILNSKAGLFKTLGDQLRRHPDRLMTTFASVAQSLEKGSYALPWMDSYNRFFIANQFKKHHECRFHLSNPIQYSTGSFSILLQKHSLYTTSISYGLSCLWETGLPKLWVANITTHYTAQKCFDKNQMLPKTSVSQLAPIKLEDLLSAFFILGAGMGLSIISFVAEVIACKVVRQK